MLNTEQFVENLTKLGITFFAGVPDSLLKAVCSCFMEQCSPENHVIAANEGGAVAQAIGHYLVSGQVPLVYMQNSGLGNAINPLLSMADDKVYGIPMLLLIGWRGEILENGSQVSDEPQHTKQGSVTEALLTAMNIEYTILDKNTQDVDHILSTSVNRTLKTQRPVALLVRKGTFTPFSLQQTNSAPSPLLSREQAIAIITENISKNAFVVSTTGMASRELFEQRKLQNQSHNSDFLVVGAMGHASQIAMRISLQYSGDVFCLDGDGSFVMHMGNIASNSRGKFCHIILNNGVHDSVGGQPTMAQNMDIPAIAKASGYIYSAQITTPVELISALSTVAKLQSSGACLIEVVIKPGARHDLGRPTLTSQEMKNNCMQFLR